jgi:hypothetical protein
MIFTPLPATPFTAVVKVLADELFATVATLLLVAAIPFTLLVKVLTDNDIVCVVAGIIAARFTAAPVTPLTVVVKLVPDKLFEIEFTMGTEVPVIPFTVVVKVLLLELFETEFIMGTACPDTPFTVVYKLLGALLVLLTVVVAFTVAGVHALPFQVNTWPLLAPVVVPNGEPFILDTTDAPKFPVISPVIFAVNADDATPLTVLMI